MTKASAPPDSAAFAIRPIIPTTGDNLTHNGRLADRLAVATTSSVALGSVLYSVPPLSTFGQEMLSSYADRPSVSSRTRITSTYSEIVEPKTLAILAVS